MGLLDALFGRPRQIRPKLDNLFALPSALTTLREDLRLEPTGRAAIAYKPVTSSQFDRLRSEIEALLQASARETQTTVRGQADKYGYQWIELEDRDFEDLVTTLHMVSQSLEEQGFGGQLLASVFTFRREERPVYWIYNYKRGSFYPFAPTGEGRKRDNPLEIRLSNIMGKELPVEEEQERWYPIWEPPV